MKLIDEHIGTLFTLWGAGMFSWLVLGVASGVADHRNRRPVMTPEEKQAHDEVIATAMLIGDAMPILCSCCLGKGRTRVIWGGFKDCGQCLGSGFDLVGYNTVQALPDGHPVKKNYTACELVPMRNMRYLRKIGTPI